MDARETRLTQWLGQHLTHFTFQPLAGDASFRRYFRVYAADRTYVAMDAPPGQEDCVPFVAVDKTFLTLGLCVPTIYAEDIQQGFLLLSDFGDERYDRVLTAANADQLYGRALDALSVIQQCKAVPGWTLPVLDGAFMRDELKAFQQWYLERHLKWEPSTEDQQILNNTFELLVTAIEQQPYFCMHRDYHSRNLMVYQGGLGILDFQSAMWGPCTYDCVSLLKDCYLTWPRESIERWALSFYERMHFALSKEEFLRAFDWMGVQRHLKAILTFSRKYHRDHDANYLCYIPPVLNYVSDVTERYPELHALHLLLSRFKWPENVVT